MRRYFASAPSPVTSRTGVTASVIARNRIVHNPVWISISVMGLAPRSVRLVVPVTIWYVFQIRCAAGRRQARKIGGLRYAATLVAKDRRAVGADNGRPSAGELP